MGIQKGVPVKNPTKARARVIRDKKPNKSLEIPFIKPVITVKKAKNKKKGRTSNFNGSISKFPIIDIKSPLNTRLHDLGGKDKILEVKELTRFV